MNKNAQSAPEVPAGDAPFDDIRREVLRNLLFEVAFEGWTEAALDRAIAETEETVGKAILFPQGVRDALDFWAAEEDHAMAEAYAALESPPQKIREKVTWLVRQRIEQMTPHREAARRAAATLALPQYATLGPRLVWRTAGAIWRALGDSSTDVNWYTKRATLSAVYGSTLARWFADDGDESEMAFADTWAFLDARIENVMAIEKAKAEMRKLPLGPEAVASFLGRIRYAADN